MASRHVSVMSDEALGYLNCAPGKCVVDCTLGGAGHAMDIIEKILPDGLLIGIDQDADAVKRAGRMLAPWTENVRLIHDNFVNLPKILLQLSIDSVDAVFADLGLSFDQIEVSGRGFSFRKDEPLDMRMNPETGQSASDIVNTLEARGLARIFKELGEEQWAGRIANKIVERRSVKSIETTGQLSDIVRTCIPRKDAARRKTDPATKVFMALRIAVNRELEVLDAFLDHAVNLLEPGGRLCVISFHSLEDRIVKQRFVSYARGCQCPPDFPVCNCGKTPQLKILSKKVCRPSEQEIARNPMSRSARMRAAEKL